jgi:Protein of unknown function (DUF3500)
MNRREFLGTAGVGAAAAVGVPVDLSLQCRKDFPRGMNETYFNSALPAPRARSEGVDRHRHAARVSARLERVPEALEYLEKSRSRLLSSLLLTRAIEPNPLIPEELASRFRRCQSERRKLDLLNAAPARSTRRLLPAMNALVVKKAGTNINFAWAGVLERGGPHYYRVQAPTFLIEYDNHAEQRQPYPLGLARFQRRLRAGSAEGALPDQPQVGRGLLRAKRQFLNLLLSQRAASVADNRAIHH